MRCRSRPDALSLFAPAIHGLLALGRVTPRHHDHGISIFQTIRIECVVTSSEYSLEVLHGLRMNLEHIFRGTMHLVAEVAVRATVQYGDS